MLTNDFEKAIREMDAFARAPKFYLDTKQFQKIKRSQLVWYKKAKADAVPRERTDKNRKQKVTVLGKRLTVAQARFTLYLVAYHHVFGGMPTMRIVAEDLGRNINGVANLMRALAAAGVLERTGDSRRGQAIHALAARFRPLSLLTLFDSLRVLEYRKEWGCLANLLPLLEELARRPELGIGGDCGEEGDGEAEEGQAGTDPGSKIAVGEAATRQGQKGD